MMHTPTHTHTHQAKIHELHLQRSMRDLASGGSSSSSSDVDPESSCPLPKKAAAAAGQHKSLLSGAGAVHLPVAPVPDASSS